ncbi:MAG TPA: hypothetical protein VFZ68_09880 [Acidimicrobiales bacterium]
MDEPLLLPRHIPRTPLVLWEPGDGPGTANCQLTWDDDRSSTIHTPYYHYWYDI